MAIKFKSMGEYDYWENDIAEDYYSAKSKATKSKETAIAEPKQAYRALFEDEIWDDEEDWDYDHFEGEVEEVLTYKVKTTNAHLAQPDYQIVGVKKTTRPKVKKRPKPPEADRPQGVFVLRKNVSELVLRRLFAKVTPKVELLGLPAPARLDDDGCYTCSL